MKKKVLAIVSTVAMLVALMPSVAFATTASASDFEGLKAACASDSNVIEVTKPIIVDESIDLEGKTIKPSASFEALYPGTTDDEEKDCNGSILIIDDSNVTIRNGEINGNGIDKGLRGIYLTKNGKNAAVDDVKFDNITRCIQGSHIYVLSGSQSLGTINITNIEIGTCDVGITGMCPNTTYNLSNITIKDAKSYGVYQNGSHGGNTYNLEDISIISSEGYGVYISGSTLVDKQALTLNNCNVEGLTAVEVKFVDTTIKSGTYLATAAFKYERNSSGGTTEGVAFATTDNTNGITDGNIVIKGGTFIGGENGHALFNGATGTDKADFDIKGGEYNTNIMGIDEGFVLVFDGEMSGDVGVNEIIISYVDEPCYVAFVSEEAAIIEGGAAFKDANGLYYTSVDYEDQAKMEQIAYHIYLNATDPDAVYDGERSAVLTIPKENEGIGKFLDENNMELPQPAPAKGFTFNGWYKPLPDCEWEYVEIPGEDTVRIHPLEFGEKLDLNAPVTEDATYFAAWDGAGSGDGNAEGDENATKTGDGFNLMLPIALALIALAGIATVLLRRKCR